MTDNFDDATVYAFAAALRQKLEASREKGRSGWETCDADRLRYGLYNHLEKGDPLDIAAYAMFLWARHEHCKYPVPPPPI